MIEQFIYTLPPVTPDQIADFERRHGITIPEPFQRFMAGPGNGGRPTPQDTFDIPTRRNNEQDCISVFDTLTRKSESEPSSLELSFQILQGRIPDETLPLASCGCGDSLLIYWTGPRSGEVWIWDHEDEGSGDNIYFVAATLDDLLASLYEFELSD